MAAKTKKMPKKPNTLGWATTDQDEIALRIWRAHTEPMQVQNLESAFDYFSTFLVRSEKSRYRVEIRSLTHAINTCHCPDSQHNGLGTCKHIEKVFLFLKAKGVRKFQTQVKEGSARIELFYRKDLSEGGNLCVQWPLKLSKRHSAYRLVQPFFSHSGEWLEDPLIGFEKLNDQLAKAKPRTQEAIRISSQIEIVLEQQRIQQEKAQAKAYFLQDIQSGKRNWALLKYPLYPYQQDGLLHLAFTERAILGDEMGLGKTIQAIGACVLLKRIRQVKRVLVVATASLKSEWLEQIAQFTDLETITIQGARSDRLRQYQQPSFFYLTNYEQIMRDHDEIQRVLQPDIVILDEAQRIKNWRTKTASAVKRLKSRYAFVLTGTPLENKIDDIYSIVQFLSPHFFGPLFRFNREYYELDESGKPSGYQNLDLLNQRLRPILLRRCKADVEGELPDRTVNTYMVEMTKEQRFRYEEFEARMAKLVYQAKRRPLTPDENKRLQRYLACMRMLCDTPYILDATCRDCPKLAELKSVLLELLTDPQTKIIIFSEWVRMLQLVRELAQQLGIGAAWHTGSVQQHKRREEINRFKTDPHCRLFLSSDAGSVGLNLQAANVVINLDLPWNPAKLEQRIARAWRKHQTRSVQVIHFVTEHSIEYRMLNLLNQKQQMAQSILDPQSDLDRMDIPSSRKQFMDQLSSLLDGEPAVEEAQCESWQACLKTHLSDVVPDAIVKENPHGQDILLAVTQAPVSDVIEKIQAAATKVTQKMPQLAVIDEQTHHIIQQLAAQGLLTLSDEFKQLAQGSDAKMTSVTPHFPLQQQVKRAKQSLEKATRQQRMAQVLIAGDFQQEALAPLLQAVEWACVAFAHLHAVISEKSHDFLTLPVIQNTLIAQYRLPATTLNLVTRLRAHQEQTIPVSEINTLSEESALLLDHIEQSITKKMTSG